MTNERDIGWLRHLTRRREHFIREYKTAIYRVRRSDCRRWALHYANLIRRWRAVTGITQ